MENKPNLFLYFKYYVLLLLLWKLTDVKKILYLLIGHFSEMRCHREVIC